MNLSNNGILALRLQVNKNYISSLFICILKINVDTMFLAHGPLGLTTAYATKKFWDKKYYTSTDRAFLYSFSQISAILPDLDLIYAIFDTDKTSHHLYITHTPLPYLILAIVILTVSILIKGKIRDLLRSINLILILNIFLHLLSDSIVSKIKLLLPLSNREFCFFHESPIIKTDNIIFSYFLTPALIILESSIIVISLYFLSKLKKERKIFLYTSLTYFIISIIALLMILLFLFLM